MRVAVCDDEKIFRDQVIQVLEQYYGKLDLTCISYEDGRSLLNEYERGTEFDALFLDIEMPILDGMETAKILRNKGCNVPILFLTSHIEMAMDGYEVAAFRFLAKPVQGEKLKQAINDLNVQQLDQKRYVIRYEGEDIILLLEDICYVEAMNNSVSIVTVHGVYTIRKKIADIEMELKELSNAFLRIHRGYIVNLMHVKRHRGNEVFVTGDVVLPLSRGIAKSFKEQLLLYVKTSAR